MTDIKCKRILLEAAPEPTLEQSKDPNYEGVCISRTQAYLGTGMKRYERRNVTSESDYSNETYIRYSNDNGKTWSEWENIHNKSYLKRGKTELLVKNTFNWKYNPVNKHFVDIGLDRIFPQGHELDYKVFWQTGRRGFRDHTYLHISKDGNKPFKKQLAKYEDGLDISDDNWFDSDFLDKNLAYHGLNIEVNDKGEIFFPVCANVEACCKILGIDVNKVFPSCPKIMSGLIVFKGVWNKDNEQYKLIPSKPMVIPDTLSSRGVNEPCIALLDNGNVIVVFRGSNVVSNNWNTNIVKDAPAHKWISISKDGGKTFSDAKPWAYDDGQAFYSSSSLHRFFRSTKNNKLYWFGNISEKNAYGNNPRYPLVMAEVDKTSGLLKKDTLTVIDDRDPKKDSENLSLSNFNIIEDRETKKIELYMTRLRSGKMKWQSNAYKYIIEV